MSASLENEAEALQASEAQNNVLRLGAILTSLSKLNEAGYFDQVENTIAELVTFLDSILEAALSDPNNENQNNAFEVLSNIYQYICSPVDQAVVDVLSFDLPKAVSKFSSISNRFSDMAICIIDQLIERCGPRDMHSSLCSALTYSSEMTEACNYIIPPLAGLSKVFVSTQRRHFEQANVAIPIILNVLNAVCLGSDNAEPEGVFDRAVEIANSLYAVCTKLECDANEKLRALLGLYVLQCTALVSASINYKAPSCHSIVLQLSRSSSYCGLSYLNLVTSYDVDTVASFVFGEDKDSMSCLSLVKHGAALSVIWGYISEEIAHSVGEDLSAFKNVLLKNQIKRWQAIGTLKHILSSVNLPWELKKHTVNFLLCITDEHNSRKYEDEHSEWSTYMPNLYSFLQAVKTVIMYAPDAELRKNSFDVLKRVLADIPISQRFDIFKALITNTDSSSMIAILIDLIRREMHMENCKNKPTGNEVSQTGNKAFPELSLWKPSVLELVELVLRPRQGGPPSLPEQSDAVLSALNLYRFTLMTESTGKTNHTGVLSRRNLQKAYNEWLLPLRTLVTGILAENKNDYDQLAVDTVCTLNPMELVLYRCIELVEEKLRQST